MSKNIVTHFRYRIHKDANIADRVNLNGIVLQKPNSETENWNQSPTKLFKLDSYVRTRENPTGVVEYEEYDALTNELLFTPYPKKASHPEYTRNELATFTREQLLKIARSYGINTVNMKEDGLVRKILETQQKFKPEDKQQHPKEDIKEEIKKEEDNSNG